MIANLKVKAEHVTSWDLAYRLALATEGKKGNGCTPNWVARILLAEHSPIRAKQYLVTIENCPTWVWTHLTRHKIGVEWFVHSQRDDRRKNDVPRAELPQGTPNDGSFLINAQALIAISRKRLCAKASAETREVWGAVCEAIREIDPVMADKMAPDCIYRFRCNELKPCGYFTRVQVKLNDKTGIVAAPEKIMDFYRLNYEDGKAD